jgi:predicted exporter
MANRVVIDVGLQHEDLNRLVTSGRRVEESLAQSGLFKSVGSRPMAAKFAQLLVSVTDRLPVLFSAAELEHKVLPLLAARRVASRLADLQAELLELGGIGQAAFISRDPLGLRELVLSRLSQLAPSKNIRIHQGSLVSADGRHLLVIADPAAPGTDTAAARRIQDLTDGLQQAFAREKRQAQNPVTLTATGAYRAALDNETMIRSDVQRALFLTTVGIVLLLVFAFPRPLIGLFALLPAVAGTLTAFFVFSFFYHSISLMVLGFGGAIISITVDHGIAYLLFVDQSQQTDGRHAAEEVWHIGLMAMLTTVGAFAALSLSGFPIFEQLGLFTALGIGLSFVFIHTVFPKIFPQLPPARRRHVPIQRLIAGIPLPGKRAAWGALVFGALMLAFARPEFNVSLSAMNSMRAESLAAEKRVSDIWGGILEHLYLMIEAREIPALQDRADQVQELMEADLATGFLSSGFTTAMIFPGQRRSRRNLQAWQAFWTPARIQALQRHLATAAGRLGFTARAFDPFLATLKGDSVQPLNDIPKAFFPLLNIARTAKGTGWAQVSTVTAGPSYDGRRFFERYGPLARVFDPALFSRELGSVLFHTFVKMLAIIGACVIVFLLLFFVDMRLTLIALLPVAFAFVSTLGTLHLLGRPLDIPSLMLAIVVFGMGIDYSLFLVRAYQRYGDPDHPHFVLIRTSVFLAAASTMVGFGALCTAEHGMLRSVGITSLLGIGYSFIGAFTILPALLCKRFQTSVKRDPAAAPTQGGDPVLGRYRNLEPYPRLFARFKQRLDPMFAELPDLLHQGRIKTIIDIGTGYAVPACWLLERFPTARLYGLEPDRRRVRVARKVLAGQGVVTCSRAPDIPVMPQKADLAVVLDMIHYLDEPALTATLENLHGCLHDGGQLLMRAVMPPCGRFPWLWWIERLRCRIHGIPLFLRSVDDIAARIRGCGFALRHCRPSGGSENLYWFDAVKPARI